MSFERVSVIVPLLCAFLCSAQPVPSNGAFNLVISTGPGRIVVPAELSGSLKLFEVYDGGQRPVARFSDTKNGIDVSYILFPNLSGNPTGDGCRRDVLEPLLKRFASSISNIKQPPPPAETGSAPVTASYFINWIDGFKVQQQNVFAFFGDEHTCAEMHLSKASYKPTDDVSLNARLGTFQADLAYTPTIKDYFTIANLLFKPTPGWAAPYYQSARALLPVNAGTVRPRRILTDQLAMSLGMSGKIAESRAVLESAVSSDPDYPLNYYNLACADAEQGDAVNAKLHLQQAFDRKANMLSGESLPDPTKDNSLLKLKHRQEFWDYAKSLSASSK